MFKKIRESLRKFFSKQVAHPVIDNRVNTVIEDKLKRIHKEQEVLTEKYNGMLNNYLKTYFSIKYPSQSDMAIAFSATNKEWQKLCRTVNSTEKLINLNKDAFKNQVKLVIDKIRENQTIKP